MGGGAEPIFDQLAGGSMTAHLTSTNALAPREPSGTGAAFASICARIRAHADADPHRVAVADAAGALTYADLVRQADGLASRLRAEGIRRGSCVGIFLERSPEFVVAALGVLWAGAAYLPVDTASPRDRVGFVLTDADVAAVVTSSAQRPNLPEGSWALLPVEGHGADGSDGEAVTPADAAPDDLAYVIYTSGSTGQPKGVELTHANLANLVDWHVAAFGVRPTDRASQVAGLGFDAAVWEIWPHLAAGAAVHFADDTTRRSPHLLRDWLVDQKITIGFVPTVLAEQVIHLPWPRSTVLRAMLTGADVLHRRPSSELPFQLVNNYGPTECTVVATSGVVAPDDDGRTTPSIGRPIAGATALVLDHALRPVPLGEQGELCLGGALVGRGYRNDPELTADRFVTVAAGNAALRVYRTGDQVRLLENGEIAFLGRLDKQVKIRGFRIEPAEIVGAIDRFPGVAASAVVARATSESDRDATAEPELVAYVVPADGAAAPTAPDLRAFLTSRLPEYMIPARFVSIDALPLTINGKLDEAALPSGAAENPVPGQAGPAGAVDGSVEEQISGMVCALLNVASIDPRENIFLAGGHSMLAMQLVLRIRQAFGVRLALRQVFEAPTVVGLTAEVERRTAGGTR
jgi:amino acid adenylation domain-containing protein